MVILNTLRIYLEVGEHREHFDQVENILRYAARSTSFVFIEKPRTRWHTPELSEFSDVGLWVANDCLITFDVTSLRYKLRRAGINPVYVLEHEQFEARPKLMLFRNKFCQRLSSDYIYKATPEQLNPECWAGGRGNIGVIKGAV